MRNLDDFAGIASDWFWETDAEHRFTYFSARMEEVTRMRASDIIGRRRDQQQQICQEDTDFAAHLDDLKNHRPFRNLEYRVKRQMCDGYMWLRVSGDPIFDADGVFQGYRGAGHDITAERESRDRLSRINQALTAKNQELEHLRRKLELAAFEDPLTGLPNRRAFDGSLANVLSQTPDNLALMIIDLDRFKLVNDTLGHPAGDMVLVTAASRIAELCDHSTKVFRIGGDEFAVVHSACFEPSVAATLGDAIVRKVSSPIMFDGQDVDIGASVGFALCKGVPTSAQRLFAQADSALYAAKRAGRNRVASV